MVMQLSVVNKHFAPEFLLACTTVAWLGDEFLILGVKPATAPPSGPTAPSPPDVPSLPPKPPTAFPDRPATPPDAKAAGKFAPTIPLLTPAALPGDFSVAAAATLSSFQIASFVSWMRRLTFVSSSSRRNYTYSRATSLMI